MSGTFSFSDAQVAAPAPGASVATAPEQPGAAEIDVGSSSPGDTAPTTFSFSDAHVPPANVTAAAQGKITGGLPNFFAGINTGLAGTFGFPVDVAQGAMNMGSKAVKAVTGYDPGQMSGAVGGSDWWQRRMGLVGADPADVVPADDTERLIRSGGVGAGSMIGPWLVAKALPALSGIPGALQQMFGAGDAGSLLKATGSAVKAGTIGTVSGVTGDVAEKYAPEPLKPLANMAGQMIGGGLTAGALDAVPAAATALTRKAADFVRPALGTPEPVFDAAGEQVMNADGTPLLATSRQQQMAGQKIVSSATDASSARDALENRAPSSIPGYVPTTFQATGDLGLGQVERQAATQQPQTFIGHVEGQNRAQVGALRGLTDPNASPEQIGQSFGQQLAALDAQHEAAVAAARTGVDASLGAAGSPTTPQLAGQAIREGVASNYAPTFAAADDAVATARARATTALDATGAAPPVGSDQQATVLQRFGQQIRGGDTSGLAGADAAAKAQVSRLYAAVDPDNTLTVDMRPITGRASQILGEMSPNAAPLSGDEAGIFDTAAHLPAVQTFNDLSTLRSRITDAMMAQRPNGINESYRRLTNLLGGVQDAMNGAVESRARSEASSVASGNVSPDQTMAGRIQAEYGDTEQSAAQQSASGANASVGAAEPSGTRQGSAGGNSGTAFPPQGRSGVDLGGPRVAAPAGSGRAPPSLLSFLVKRGGLVDNAGELAAMDAGKIRRGLVPNSGGIPLDMAREAAEEAGYLPADSSINDLLDSVNQELHGRPVYPPEYVAPSRDAARFQDALNDARSQVSQSEDDLNARLSPAEIEHAVQLVSERGLHPEDAVMQAMRSSDEAALSSDTARRAFGEDGLPTGATQREMDVARQQRPADVEPATFDAEAAARYQAARAAHAERKSTFTNAPGVGSVLKSGARAGEYALPDSQVPAAIFSAGKGAAERMQAAIRAGGDRGEIMGALQDYAAFDMRRTVAPDGVFKPAAYQRWMDNHAEAMASFPELRARFDTAARAQKVLADVQGQRAALNDAYPIKPGWGDADVAAQFFRPGPSGGEAAQRLLNATGNQPRAVSAVRDYAAQSLRAAAERDGVINKPAYDRWMRAHDSALSEFPSVKSSFEDVGKAQSTLDDALRAHATARQQFEKSVAGQFLGDKDPVAGVKRLIMSDNGVANARQLRTMMANDPVGMAGVKRATFDMITRDYIGNFDDVKGNAFLNFMRTKAPVLAEYMSPREMGVLRDMADNVKQMAESIRRTKLAGGSNTAQDTAHSGHGKTSVFNTLIGAEALEHVGGAKAKIAGLIGTMVLGGARKTGLQAIDNLVAQSIHPDVALALMRKVPVHEVDNQMARVMNRVRAVTLTAAYSQGQPATKPLPQVPHAGDLATPRSAATMMRMTPTPTPAPLPRGLLGALPMPSGIRRGVGLGTR